MLNNLIRHQIFKQILLFGAVGSIGFIVDSAVLYLFKTWLGLYGARLISFIAAVWVTWWLNRNITFQKSHYQSIWREFFHYFVCMLTGGLINIGTYGLLVYHSQYMATNPIFAVAIGSLTGMMVNFMASKLIAFKNH